jgi:dTDP-glucose 4,6-dehydratase
MRTKRILITGGCGFIGSNFIKYKLNENFVGKIINLDKLTYAGNLKNLTDVEKDQRYKFVKGDINDKKLIFNIFKKEKPDYIINFASESHVDKSILSSSIFVKTNVLGVNNLLEISKNFKINKFIQISTDEVYGSIRQGRFKEKSILNPSSPYSASKASADMIVQSYIKTYDFPAIIIRLSNNFGPFQNLEKFMPLVITNFLKKKKIPIFGNGKNIREWIYVFDSCSAIDKIVQKGKIGEVYNVGSGEEFKNIEIVKFIEKKLKVKENLINFVEDRKGHDFRYSLDTQKTKKLGWKLKYNHEKSLMKTIKWYSDNDWWWQCS